MPRLRQRTAVYWGRRLICGPPRPLYPPWKPMVGLAAMLGTIVIPELLCKVSGFLFGMKHIAGEVAKIVLFAQAGFRRGKFSSRCGPGSRLLANRQGAGTCARTLTRYAGK